MASYSRHVTVELPTSLRMLMKFVFISRQLESYVIFRDNIQQKRQIWLDGHT